MTDQHLNTFVSAFVRDCPQYGPLGWKQAQYHAVGALADFRAAAFAATDPGEFR